MGAHNMFYGEIEEKKKKKNNIKIIIKRYSSVVSDYDNSDYDNSDYDNFWIIVFLIIKCSSLTSPLKFIYTVTWILTPRTALWWS